MARKSTHTLTEGPVSRAILVVSAPMAIGVLAVLSVGIADAYFLGQIGTAELAAVAFIFPVTSTIISLSIGLSAGTNAALSQAIGRGASDSTLRRKTVHALGVGAVMGVAVAALTWVSAPVLFGALGAEGAVLDAVLAYMPLWCLSFPLLVVVMICETAFRARGDGARAATVMTTQAVVNIALDPLFIFGWWIVPQMDTEGAALATLVARILSAALALTWAWRRGLLGRSGGLFDGFTTSARQMFSVGVPAAMSNAINPAGLAMVTAAVATLGDVAVGGFGAATRIQALALVPFLALSAGIGPVIGQNWGADQQARARDAMRLTFLFCAGYGLVVALILMIAADPIAAWIASSPEAATYTAQYLRVVGWSLAGYGILVTANAAMNARSRAVWSMALSLGRIFAVYLPLAWLGVWLFGYTGILAAAATANVLVIWAALIATRATGLLTLEFSPIARPAIWLKPLA